MALAVFVSGIVLNETDKFFEIKRNVISALKMLTNSTPSGLYRVNVSMEEFSEKLEKTKIEFTNPSKASENQLCPDRKSTRLNSSHLVISYAVFCLKKKKKKNVIRSPIAM